MITGGDLSYSSSPDFVTAKTAKLLQKKIRILNAKDGGVYRIYSTYFAAGYHYAWFYKELQQTLNKELENELN